MLSRKIQQPNALITHTPHNLRHLPDAGVDADAVAVAVAAAVLAI